MKVSTMRHPAPPIPKYLKCFISIQCRMKEIEEVAIEQDHQPAHQPPLPVQVSIPLWGFLSAVQTPVCS